LEASNATNLLDHELIGLLSVLDQLLLDQEVVDGLDRHVRYPLWISDGLLFLFASNGLLSLLNGLFDVHVLDLMPPRSNDFKLFSKRWWPSSLSLGFPLCLILLNDVVFIPMTEEAAHRPVMIVLISKSSKRVECRLVAPASQAPRAGRILQSKLVVVLNEVRLRRAHSHLISDSLLFACSGSRFCCLTSLSMDDYLVLTGLIQWNLNNDIAERVLTLRAAMVIALAD